MNDPEDFFAPPQDAERGPAGSSQEERKLTLEELRELYGNGGGRSKTPGRAEKYPSKYLFVCALLGLLGCIVLTVATFASFAHPLTVIGNKNFSEAELDIFSFIANRIQRLRDSVNGISDANAEAIIGAFGIVQAVLAVFAAAVVLIASITYTIMAAVRFSHRKDTVCAALVGLMRWNFIAYFLYPFIVNTSGGQGDAYYSIGFAPGIGMNIGMALGLGILCAAAVCTGLAYCKEWETRKQMWGLVAIVAVVSTCGCGLFCILPLYSVVMYVFSSSLGTVFSAISSGAFSFSGFAFTVFNLLLLICALTEYQLLARGAEKNWRALVCRSSFRQMLAMPAKKKRRSNRAGPLLRLVILSVLCLICIIVLGVPSIGLGWSVQLMPQFIALTAISTAGFVAYLVWKSAFREKNKQQATRADPAATPVQL